MSGLIMSMSSEQDSHHLASNLSVSEVVDRLEVMHQQESTTYKCRDYINDGDEDTCSYPVTFNRGPQNERDMPVDRDCRVKMCEWCYQVTDFCKFKRETVAIAMSYLDRFLSTTRPRAHKALHDRKEYQLAAMTSLYIAIKLFEPVAMDAELLSTISHGCYTESDIVDMEQEILTALSWRVNGPTAHDFLSHIISLLPSSAHKYDDTVAMTLLDFSRFQVEIAVCDYDLALQKPSVVALASILNSVESIDEKLFSRRSQFDFFQCVARVTGLDPFSKGINVVRARLLDLFEHNSGYSLPQIAVFSPIVSTTSRISKMSTPASPVSVQYFPRCA